MVFELFNKREYYALISFFLFLFKKKKNTQAKKSSARSWINMHSMEGKSFERGCADSGLGRAMTRMRGFRGGGSNAAILDLAVPWKKVCPTSHAVVPTPQRENQVLRGKTGDGSEWKKSASDAGRCLSGAGSGAAGLNALTSFNPNAAFLPQLPRIEYFSYF
jgi:hypothetical protein